MIINGKEYNLDEIFKFKKIKNYCNEYDVLYSYNVVNKTAKFKFSKKLSEILKSLKINVNNIELKLTDKLIYKYGYFPEGPVSNPFLADCVNEVINEIVETNNRILEIE